MSVFGALVLSARKLRVASVARASNFQLQAIKSCRPLDFLWLLLTARQGGSLGLCN